MNTLAKEVRDHLNVIDSTLETQHQGCAHIPVKYLEDMRETLQRVLDDNNIPTLTDYVNKRHGGVL